MSVPARTVSNAGSYPQPLWRRVWRRRRNDEEEKRLPLRKQAVLQAVCVFIAFTVIFPIMWVVSLALDPRGLPRPDGLNLIPPGASLDSFVQVIQQPTSNPIDFLGLFKNSFILAASTSIFSIGVGVSAAYAFSRLQFRGRQVLMLGILAVLMLPPVVTIVPLFAQFNQIRFDLPLLGPFNLRQSLAGVSLAVISGLLPFAIWNLKGYLDTIPKELEEAASVDGATRNQAFRLVILPLAIPALAVTAFLGFLAGWTEYYFSVTFLTGKVESYTLAVALNTMVGQYATQTPWAHFSAFAILFALPVSIVYLALQKYIVSGLAIGGVKG
ncbi:MAG TPA: ABC transporter permease subunit [Candidatus Limnocylindria bacterium]|nr:ABC transporter permease subunit [Candidatus Limnocylindria bacterium]